MKVSLVQCFINSDPACAQADEILAFSARGSRTLRDAGSCKVLVGGYGLEAAKTEGRR